MSSAVATLRWNQRPGSPVFMGMRALAVHVEAPAPAARSTFDGFFERAWPGAYRLAVLLTQNVAAGEDVAQEAMTKLYSHWSGVDHPDAYLRRSIVNLAMNRSRRERTRRVKLPLVAVPDAVEFAAGGELTDAIARLPYRQRAVIVLRYYGDLSEAEIAQTLGCRPGTVKSLASRALAQLGKEIDR